MYYIFVENGKLNGAGEGQILNENVINYEVDEELYNAYLENQELYIWDGLQIIINPNYEEEQAQKEKDRIQELFMTRSDFFDGTIMAWGVGEKQLLPLIEAMVGSLPLDEKLKLKAINNFENAQNFYRKHDLFKMIVNVPIKLSETAQVVTTDEHWDKFFDETAKKNLEAYLELPALEPIESEEI